MFVAIQAPRHFGKHLEYFVTEDGRELGRYSRTGYSNSLVAVTHPVRDASPERPYLLFIDRDEVEVY